MAEGSALYYKALVVELRIRAKQEPRIQTNDSTIQHMLTQFSTIETDIICWPPAPNEIPKDDLAYLKMLPQSEILSRLRPAFGKPDLFRAIDKLIGDELQAYGINVQPIPEHILISRGLISLVGEKLDMVIDRELFNPMNAAPNVEESFVCYLYLLVGGWATNIKKVKMWFNNANSFEHFLIQLQEATRGCVVPPKNVGWPDSLVQQGESHDPKDPIFRHRALNETGYTLQDGPWLYRVTKTYNNQKRYHKHKPIACNDHYDAMKDEIQLSWVQWNAVKGKGHWQEPHIMVTHSMDFMAMRMQEEQEKSYRKDEESFEGRFARSLVDNGYNTGSLELKDAGESLTAWVKRMHKETQARLQQEEDLKVNSGG